MKPKPKRRPRRRLPLVCCIGAAMMLLIAALLIDQVTRDVPLTSTPECVGVDPLNVGNMVDKGAMVVGCLERANHGR